ncbi:MAG TPA: hypothetical protein VFM45_11370 [Anaeromyxobacteraceae bacterium]|nr:hypothetical protein [Anaeromyxobacteraceae bacterium]
MTCLAIFTELGLTLEGIYRLCYIRGSEDILIGLAQQLGQQPSREDPLDRRR